MDEQKPRRAAKKQKVVVEESDDEIQIVEVDGVAVQPVAADGNKGVAVRGDRRSKLGKQANKAATAGK